MTDTHVIPVDDLMPHRETRECWCCPTFESVDGLDAIGTLAAAQYVFEADLVVIHNALDMREQREKA